MKIRFFPNPSNNAMQIIGITCSTAAAFFWAVAIILFKKSGDHFSPMALNLLKCTVTLILLIPTLLLCGIDLFPEKPAYDWIMFCVSGLLGIALADTLFLWLCHAWMQG